ncbi:protein SHQ1 homolog [Schistocerca gregaria]|uniref:protein SHQ1 homolog n=1 Tax=Schistocerca gregaria TaxID=7010 RepID=UPI00211E58FB|nr:protein SHQ1 homolog [Schistocerca gregaria]
MRVWFCTSSASLGYGFLGRYRGYFKDFCTSSENEYKWWLLEAIDNPDPEGLTVQQRHELRIEKENLEFDVDHYLADLFEPNEEFKSVMEYETVWNVEWRRRKARGTKGLGSDQSSTGGRDRDAMRVESGSEGVFATDTAGMESSDARREVSVDSAVGGRHTESADGVRALDEGAASTRGGGGGAGIRSGDVTGRGSQIDDSSSVNDNTIISIGTTSGRNEDTGAGLKNRGSVESGDVGGVGTASAGPLGAEGQHSSGPAHNGDTTPAPFSSLFSKSSTYAQLLRGLPRREYLYTPAEEWACFLSLIDLVFVYAFNHRICEGENSTESYWNVAKLSATLSWFDLHYTVQQVLVSSYRRALCYPLYRSWVLCQKVCRDVIQIFSLGRCALMCCLLELKRLCDMAELGGRYLTQLYLDDYAVWIQKAEPRKIKAITRMIKQTYRTVSKEDLGFELREMERMAQANKEMQE